MTQSMKLSAVKLFAAFIALALLTLGIIQSKLSTAKVKLSGQSATATLIAAAQRRENVLMIVNRGRAKWHGVSVYINGVPPHGYRCAFGDLGPSQTVVIPLVEFKNDKEQKFNPINALTEVWVGAFDYDYVKIL